MHVPYTLMLYCHTFVIILSQEYISVTFDYCLFPNSNYVLNKIVAAWTDATVHFDGQKAHEMY